ncbi:MAG: hypothetical protein H6551_10540 [Chitinophagales bacterium]|nr:hypothetical protein [Chitinophagaceae bacterium]MCB9065566.1 hypothetical protein [Chitinophagales bacterium]
MGRTFFILTIFLLGSYTTCIASDQQDVLFDTVVRGNNTFEVEDASEIVMVEEKNDVYVTEINSFPIPRKMNGLNIYNPKDVNQPATVNGKVLKQHLLNNMKEVTSKLPDGVYAIRLLHIVLSHEGQIVYYDFDGIRMKANDGSMKRLNNNLTDATEKAISKAMKTVPKYKPAYIYHSAVVSMISNEEFEKPFHIKNGKVIIPQ